MDREPKTTKVSGEDSFHPLEVAWWKPELRCKIVNGVSQRVDGWEVALVMPGNEYRTRTHILHLEPQTALNLLTWLEQEREALEELASKDD